MRLISRSTQQDATLYQERVIVRPSSPNLPFLCTASFLTPSFSVGTCFLYIIVILPFTPLFFISFISRFCLLLFSIPLLIFYPSLSLSISSSFLLLCFRFFSPSSSSRALLPGSRNTPHSLQPPFQHTLSRTGTGESTPIETH